MQPPEGRYLFASSLRGYGGGERWMLDAAAGLGDRGHAVVLAARPGSALLDRARGRGVGARSVEMRGDFDPIAILELARIIRSFRPHVVCVNLDREVRLCALAIQAAGRRSATRLIPRRGSEFPLKDKPLYRWIYTRRVDRVIVNSEATRRTMVSRTPWFPSDKAVVIYNGIDATEYDRFVADRESARRALRESFAFPEDASVVVVVGELSERKRQVDVVAAAPDILASVPDARFVFVGEGPARGEVESAVAAKGLENRVVLAGFRRDVPAIVAGSDILLLPSRVEGFGYVLVEAMAAALPVVASNASSIPEIVVDGETGLLHEVGDTRAIAESVTRLLLDPDRAREMGRAGRRVQSARFAMDRMLDDVEALFAEPARR